MSFSILMKRLVSNTNVGEIILGFIEKTPIY
jgi:hypothetical protein